METIEVDGKRLIKKKGTDEEVPECPECYFSDKKCKDYYPHTHWCLSENFIWIEDEA